MFYEQNYMRQLAKNAEKDSTKIVYLMKQMYNLRLIRLLIKRDHVKCAISYYKQQYLTKRKRRYKRIAIELITENLKDIDVSIKEYKRVFYNNFIKHICY
jgi:hypothetical protein